MTPTEGGDDFRTKRPYIPFHINILFDVSKESCSRKFYLELNKTESDVPLCEFKWNNKFDYLLHKHHWKVLYKICFQSLTDNSFVWFQYRILYMILGTNEYLNKLKISDSSLCGLCEYLNKLKISDSNLCGLCGNQSESIMHLLYKFWDISHMTKTFGLLISCC